MAIIYCTS